MLVLTGGMGSKETKEVLEKISGNAVESIMRLENSNIANEKSCFIYVLSKPKNMLERMSLL